MLKRSQPLLLLQIFSYILLLVLCSIIASAESAKLMSSPEATALLGFQSKADLRNHLGFSHNASFRFCDWQGVTCYEQRVVRVILEDLDLGGIFAPNTLSRLPQLRVLSLQNNSFTGPIPDLSGLVNLKTLFLDRNFFTGSFPLSLLSLRRIRTLDLSYNNLTGPIPTSLASLDPLYYLRLDRNRLNGTIPPFNQSSLKTFNVSGNNLTGAIPVTPTLLQFEFSCFSWNPGLCGEIIRKECHPRPHFFAPTAAVAPPPPMVALGQSAEEHGVELAQPQPSSKEHKRTAFIIGFSTGVLVLIGSLLCFVMAVRKQTDKKQSTAVVESDDGSAAAQAAAAIQMEQENELEEKVKRVQGMQVAKSGNLIFFAGEAQLYSLDQLMRASAELLGRGSIGTTYKAVLDNCLVMTVKRLDAGKLAATTKETFEQHIESVGGLRHPNLVPLRAYFQAKQERLLIYDFQTNGSLFFLIHGSKTRARPLHWTSCLKIAEDVAQGLSYIHQAWRLVHGNLKSSNVLLGPDFEACLSDYCLTALVTCECDQDPDSIACKPPETRNSNHQATSKSDVFAYGILLLELLTGKPPSQHPCLDLDEMMHWLRSCREGDGGDDVRLGMLLEVAIACCLSSPEQRPTMWQVLKMLQEIKEAVLMEDGELDPLSGMS